jgi:uncharacterized protein Yka (UPF0111/DUF47 family)
MKYAIIILSIRVGATENPTEKNLKKSLKKLRKMLDKRIKIWYNIDTKVERVVANASKTQVNKKIIKELKSYERQNDQERNVHPYRNP